MRPKSKSSTHPATRSVPADPSDEVQRGAGTCSRPLSHYGTLMRRRSDQPPINSHHDKVGCVQERLVGKCCDQHRASGEVAVAVVEQGAGGARKKFGLSPPTPPNAALSRRSTWLKSVMMSLPTATGEAEPAGHGSLPRPPSRISLPALSTISWLSRSQRTARQIEKCLPSQRVEKRQALWASGGTTDPMVRLR